MLFNSPQFIIFFPIVVLLYFLCPYRFRWVLLLCASYYFYMCWEARYALLMGLS
ncbi:MAG TPA: MBOAT family protein, partial [Candidatus Omnitrophota bacterium]|nr:MBOAT family protein [Candidatus Omnitrophota bacterium]